MKGGGGGRERGGGREGRGAGGGEGGREGGRERRTILWTAAVHPEPVKRMMSSAAFPVTRAFTDSEGGRERKREGGREGQRGREEGREGGREGGKREPTGDDLAGLMAIECGLHAGDGGGCVGITVEGHYFQA